MRATAANGYRAGNNSFSSRFPTLVLATLVVILISGVTVYYVLLHHQNVQHYLESPELDKLGRLDQSTALDFAVSHRQKSVERLRTQDRIIRVAYVFAGSARSFTCAKVHWSIRSHLIDALGSEPYVFVRVATEDNQNTKTGMGVNRNIDFGENVLNETLKILNPREVQHFQFSTQLTEMQAQFPSLEHEVVRTNDLRRYSMYYHRSMAYRMVVEYERRHALRFDWVILARLDTQWLEPILPIDKYLEDRVWVTETGYDMFNDQFMMIPRNFSDYMYDLNTKIRKSVYCLGGPDLKPDVCDKKKMAANQLSNKMVKATTQMCCSDINGNNRQGFSERIHLRHLREGKIPVSLGRFPVFIVRTNSARPDLCRPECFRIQVYNYKVYMFMTGTGLYPYMAPYQWPDSRGAGMSVRDENICLYMEKTYFPWNPTPAATLHKTLASSVTGFDYSRSLFLQNPYRVDPSIVLDKKDLEVWRIHPTYNIDNCLQYENKHGKKTATESGFEIPSTGARLIWNECFEHNGKELASAGRFDPRQLFFVEVIPHENDPTFPRRQSWLDRAREIDYYTDIAEGRAIRGIHESNTPSAVSTSSVSLPFASPGKVKSRVKSTRIMIPDRAVGVLGHKGTFLCVTVSAIAVNAAVYLDECVLDGSVSTTTGKSSSAQASKKASRQLFLPVDGLLKGSHSPSTIGALRLAADPTLCVARGDNAIPPDGNKLSKVPKDNRLFLYLCTAKRSVDKQLFEFEMILS